MVCGSEHAKQQSQRDGGDETLFMGNNACARYARFSMSPAAKIVRLSVILDPNGTRASWQGAELDWLVHLFGTGRNKRGVTFSFALIRLCRSFSLYSFYWHCISK